MSKGLIRTGCTVTTEASLKISYINRLHYPHEERTPQHHLPGTAYNFRRIVLSIGTLPFTLIQCAKMRSPLPARLVWQHVVQEGLILNC